MRLGTRTGWALGVGLNTGLFPEGDVASLKILGQRSSIWAFTYLFSHPFVYLGNFVSAVEIKQRARGD